MRTHPYTRAGSDWSSLWSRTGQDRKGQDRTPIETDEAGLHDTPGWDRTA